MARHGFVSTVVLAGLVALAGGLFYVRVVHPTIWARNFGEVRAGVLYRSGALTPAALERVVRAHGVRTIVNLGAFDHDPERLRAEEATARALGAGYVRLHLNGDGTGDPEQYARALAVIGDPAQQPVLVHCAAGAERTGACVMLYRHVFEGVPLERALIEAEAFGHDEHRNGRLMPYVRAHSAQIGQRVHQLLGADAPVPVTMN